MSGLPTEKLDMEYLKSENIGKVIAKGLAVLYEEKPKFPVDFLAKWLLNHSATVQNEKQIEGVLKQKEQLRKKNEQQKLQILKKEQEEKKKQQDIQLKDEDFKQKIQNEEYHNEMIEQIFPEYINNRLGLTGVYIGKKDFSVKEINDNEQDENAHLNTGQNPVINYIGYSQNHSSIMKGKTLGLEQGVTAQVWKVKEQEEQPQDGGEALPPPQTYVYVPDLVKEKRMKYFRLPQLGAFMAAPMIFESYLHDAAFDKGVQQRLRFQEAKENQDKERAVKQQEFNDKLKELEDTGDPSAEEFKANWEAQKAAWVDEKEAPFEAKKMEYVLSSDTMGQDQQFNQKQREFIEAYAKLFAESWQEKERELLSADIDRQIAYIKSLPAAWKDLQANYLENEQKSGQERGAQVEEIKAEHPAEWEYEVNIARLEKVKEQISDKTFQEQFINLRENRVFKFQGILQNILYLLGYARENINIPGTHLLNWKEVKNLLNQELFDQILEYNPRGQQPDAVQPYALINRLIAKLEKFEQDAVDSYNLCYGRLLRWILLTVQVRQADIIIRREQIEKRKKDRQAALEQTTNINTEQENYINAKKEELAQLPEQEAQAFDMQGYIKDFDEKNPLPEIPDEVEDDVDNDCEFE